MPASMQVPHVCQATLQQAVPQVHCIGEGDALRDLSPTSQSHSGQVETLQVHADCTMLFDMTVIQTPLRLRECSHVLECRGGCCAWVQGEPSFRPSNSRPLRHLFVQCIHMPSS